MRPLLFTWCVVLALLALVVSGVEAQCWRAVTSARCDKPQQCYWAAVHYDCLPWCMYCVSWRQTAYNKDPERNNYWDLWKDGGPYQGPGHPSKYGGLMKQKPSMLLAPDKLETKFRDSFLLKMGNNSAPAQAAEESFEEIQLRYTIEWRWFPHADGLQQLGGHRGEGTAGV
jgi:hypothetical protein